MNAIEEAKKKRLEVRARRLNNFSLEAMTPRTKAAYAKFESLLLNPATGNIPDMVAASRKFRKNQRRFFTSMLADKSIPVEGWGDVMERAGLGESFKLLEKIRPATPPTPVDMVTAVHEMGDKLA